MAPAGSGEAAAAVVGSNGLGSGCVGFEESGREWQRASWRTEAAGVCESRVWKRQGTATAPRPYPAEAAAPCPDLAAVVAVPCSDPVAVMAGLAEEAGDDGGSDF